MEPAKVETVVRLATPDAKLRLLADRWRARAKENLAPSRYHERRGRPAEDAGRGCELREIGATG
jgi:hypothetical protein